MIVMRAIFALLFLYEGVTHHALAGISAQDMSVCSIDDCSKKQEPTPSDLPLNDASQPSEHICHLNHTFFVTPEREATVAEQRVEIGRIIFEQIAPTDPILRSPFKPPRV